MKIAKIVKKDLKLLKRDPKTLALIILGPLLIIVILGSIFGQSTGLTSLSGLKIGLCNLDQEYDAQEITYLQVEYLEGNCREIAKQLVSDGTLRAALMIPEGFSANIREGHGSELILYLDNSKTQTAIIASESIKALVQNLNEKIGTDFINEAWKNLKKLNENLKNVLKEVSVAKEQTEAIQKDIIRVQSDLNGNETEDFQNDLIELNKTTSNNTISKQINFELSTLKYLYTTNCPLNLTKEQCSLINNSIEEIEVLRLDIKEKEDSVSEGISEIFNTQNELNNELTKINQTFFDYSDSLVRVINELNETTQLLDEYITKDPKYIVRAVSLNEDLVFGQRTYFEFLVPGLMLILLLFTVILVSSSNIVNERKIGTLARTLLSPTSIVTFIIAKLIYFLIIAAIEIIVMLIVIRLAGVSIPLTTSVILVFLISSISFISIGIFLGAASNSENTALLSSLVISLPMFFLSNLLFPFEIMPKLMKTIGSNLPLTISINSLDKLIIYQSILDKNELIKLIVISLILLIITYIVLKRKPTAEES